MSDSALTAIEFLVIGHFELKRYEGWKKYKTVRDPVLSSEGSALAVCRDAEVVSKCNLAMPDLGQTRSACLRRNFVCAGLHLPVPWLA